MRDDKTPLNMQAPAIPVLTDIVSRGSKAPPEKKFTTAEHSGSEDPTQYPVEDPTPQTPEADFSLDELTEPPTFNLDELTDVTVPVSDNVQINELVEQAMAQLMPELEKTARKLLTDLAEASQKSRKPSDH